MKLVLWLEEPRIVYERHFPRITRNYSQISKSACYFGVVFGEPT